MLEILADRTFRRLFAAQVVALVGTGLATVALGLLAFDLAGQGAPLVLGTILTIKMVAFVTLSPFAAALAQRVDRRWLLVSLDLVRAGAALALPFVEELWQVYALVFVLQAASALFTPTFQATLPDVLPDEARYTRALSLSRLAYDIESVASPVLAALLLALVSFDSLFLGTVVGFAASALLVLSVVLPRRAPTGPARSFGRDAAQGIRVYLATPRLRGLLALSFSVAAAGSMVLVNSIGLVRAELGLGEAALGWTMAAFGAGSMVGALALPPLLDRWRDRPVMAAGTALMALSLLALAAVALGPGLTWSALLVAWAVAGLGTSAVMTPAGRLLRRSAAADDRPGLFAAQFALSHACWLVCYPFAGWLMTELGPVAALVILANLALAGLVVALNLWPAGDPVEIPHDHHNLPPDHPHMQGGEDHSHAYVIDDLHPRWPRR
ncbi:MAG: MFS transporter [Pseudomonadota bacterium]